MNALPRSAALAAVLLAACSGTNAASDDSTSANAACGVAIEVYQSIGGEKIVASYDGAEVITVWRTADDLIYTVRADKNEACIEHVGREIDRIPL